MTTALYGELVGGPHDGLRFDIGRMARAFPPEQVPHLPDRVMVGLPGDTPSPLWPDTVHGCFGFHVPLIVYGRPEIGDTRYLYVGPFPCKASNQ